MVGAHHDAQEDDHKRRYRIQRDTVGVRGFLGSRLLNVGMVHLVVGFVSLGCVRCGHVKKVTDFRRFDEHAALYRFLLACGTSRSVTAAPILIHDLPSHRQ